jgi:ABC-type sugar transport system substrate-binding protein
MDRMRLQISSWRARLRPLLLLVLLLPPALLAAGCRRDSASRREGSGDSGSDRLVVGFCQVNHANPWRIAETNDIRSEAARRGYELVLLDGESSPQKQVADIESLIARRVDYIILAPKEFATLRPAILAARDAGIPLVLVDRMADAVPGEDFLTFIGSDFVEEGERVARWLAAKTGGQARIVELRGEKGSSPEIDRAIGFRNVIDSYPGMEIVASSYAHFERLEGQKVMEEIILAIGPTFDAVYAHSDEMAIGAIQALKAAGIHPGRDVVLVSIDGSKDALKAIIAGELGASVECAPRFAGKIFDVIDAHRRGEPIPPRIINEDRLFDIENARELIHDAY